MQSVRLSDPHTKSTSLTDTPDQPCGSSACVVPEPQSTNGTSRTEHHSQSVMHFSHPLYGVVDNMGFCSLNDISLNSDLQGSFTFSEVSFDHNLTSTPIQLANLSKSKRFAY